MHCLYNKNVSMVNELKLETADLILAKRNQCIHNNYYTGKPFLWKSQ